MTEVNSYNQVLGERIQDWQPRQAPEAVTLEGKSCVLEPLSGDKHAKQLFDAYKNTPTIWTYIPIGPFEDVSTYRNVVDLLVASRDTHFAIIDKTTGRAVGQICLLRADPQNGVVEVGYVIFSQELKRTTMAAEAQYLLMKYVFDSLKYRRYEWKCDSLNAPSRNAAQRLGFQFEGTFRQAQVNRNRNRDTQWFSILDKEWPTCRQVFEAWLSDDNFNNGRQKAGMNEIRDAIVKSHDL